MKNVIESILAKHEKESWKEKTESYFMVYFSKTIQTKHKNGITGRKKEWFQKKFRCQTVAPEKEISYAITEEQAFQFAGNGGTVIKETIISQRIK